MVHCHNNYQDFLAAMLGESKSGLEVNKSNIDDGGSRLGHEVAGLVVVALLTLDVGSGLCKYGDTLFCYADFKRPKGARKEHHKRHVRKIGVKKALHGGTRRCEFLARTSRAPYLQSHSPID